MSELDTRLGQLLYERTISQTDLSEVTEIDIAQLNGYCRGKKTPNLYTFKVIVQALRLSAEETFWLLFGGNDGTETAEI